jgi:cytoskeletal protein CcmA (bactofilin family)
MFGQKRKRNSFNIETLVGRNTTLKGDIHFTGGLHIDGTVKGNVIADEGTSSVLSLSEHGCIKGEVRVPNVTLNGKVMGDVHASQGIELASHASVTGDVFYNLIEMAMGAEVNGKLVHVSEAETAQVKSGDKPAAKPVPVKETAPLSGQKLAGKS